MAQADYTPSQIATIGILGFDCGTDTTGAKGTDVKDPYYFNGYPVISSQVPTGFFTQPDHFCAWNREHRICGPTGCDTVATNGWDQYSNTYVANTGSYTGANDFRENNSFYSIPPNPAPSATLSATSPIDTGTQPTLTYTCANSSAGAIDNGVGPVTADGNSHQILAPAINTNTTYTLTCSQNGPSATASATVKVTGGIKAPQASLTAAPQSVDPNGTAALTYQCTNSSSGSIDQGVAPIDVTDGKHHTVSTPALSTPTTFTLTCNGSNGSIVTAQTTVGINPKNPPPPGSCNDISLWGPESVNASTPFTLYWSELAGNSTSVVLTEDQDSNQVPLVPPSATQGTYLDPGVSTNTTFTENFVAKCIDLNGDTNSSLPWPVTINAQTIGGNLPSCTLSPNSQTIPYGSQAPLSWTSTNAVSCTGIPTDFAGGAISGNQVNVSPTYTTSYYLRCSDNLGNTTQCGPAQVSVTGPTCSISNSAAPTNLVLKGNPVTISWTIGGSKVDSCTETGPGLSSASKISGSSSPIPVNNESTYTIDCKAAHFPDCVKSTTVQIAPTYKEK